MSHGYLRDRNLLTVHVFPAWFEHDSELEAFVFAEHLEAEAFIDSEDVFFPGVAFDLAIEL